MTALQYPEPGDTHADLLQPWVCSTTKLLNKFQPSDEWTYLQVLSAWFLIGIRVSGITEILKVFLSSSQTTLSVEVSLSMHLVKYVSVSFLEQFTRISLAEYFDMVILNF